MKPKPMTLEEQLQYLLDLKAANPPQSLGQIHPAYRDVSAETLANNALLPKHLQADYSQPDFYTPTAETELSRPPLGSRCQGIRFRLPNMQMEVGRGETVEPGVARYAARPARWCKWRLKLTEERNDGDVCATCGLLIQDYDIGCLPMTHIQPATAVIVYLEQVNKWVLIEVAELPPIKE